MSSDLQNPNGHCVGPNSEMAGKAESCKGCPNAAICAMAPKGPDPDLVPIRNRMSHIKHKILVLSGKGGVGKSTLTKELGFALGRKGLTVGLVDTDICGPSLPRLTGVRDEEVHSSADGWEPVSVDENVSLVSMHFLMGNNRNEAVIWRGPKKNGMIKNFLKEVCWGDLDVLLFDTPPGTSDEHISTVNFLKDCGGVTGAIIITTPQEVAVSDVRREVSFCHKSKVPILGFVENMSGFVCPKCETETQIFPSKYKGGAAQKLSDEYGAPVLGKIPLDPLLMKACEKGVPLVDAIAEEEEKEKDSDSANEKPKRISPTHIAIASVVDKLVALLEENNKAAPSPSA